jgi:predicted Rossmann fold nucleotide-binding protein DprA/Smf involved in DNA uptake
LASQLAERGITIVSGLAFGVDAVTHAAALHTARSALERGIDVLVVPGNITNPNSVCCNNLIKSGATPVTSVEDILFALGADNLATTTFDQEVEVYLEFLLTLSPHLLFQDKSKRWAS